MNKDLTVDENTSFFRITTKRNIMTSKVLNPIKLNPSSVIPGPDISGIKRDQLLTSKKENIFDLKLPKSPFVSVSTSFVLNPKAIRVKNKRMKVSNTLTTVLNNSVFETKDLNTETKKIGITVTK